MVLGYPKMTLGAVKLYSALRMYCNADHLVCWPSLATLATMTSLTKQGLKKARKKLAALGLVEIDREDPQKPEYILQEISPEAVMRLADVLRVKQRKDRGIEYVTSLVWAEEPQVIPVFPKSIRDQKVEKLKNLDWLESNAEKFEARIAAVKEAEATFNSWHLTPTGKRDFQSICTQFGTYPVFEALAKISKLAQNNWFQKHPIGNWGGYVRNATKDKFEMILEEDPLGLFEDLSEDDEIEDEGSSKNDEGEGGNSSNPPANRATNEGQPEEPPGGNSSIPGGQPEDTRGGNSSIRGGQLELPQMLIQRSQNSGMPYQGMLVRSKAPPRSYLKITLKKANPLTEMNQSCRPKDL